MITFHMVDLFIKTVILKSEDSQYFLMTQTQANIHLCETELMLKVGYLLTNFSFRINLCVLSPNLHISQC